MNKYYLGQTLTINSIFHFIFPLLIGYILGDKWKIGVLVLIAFEIAENFSGLTFNIGNWEIFSAEPIVNIATDLIIGMVGLFVGKQIRQKQINNQIKIY